MKYSLLVQIKMLRAFKTLPHFLPRFMEFPYKKWNVCTYNYNNYMTAMLA